MVIMGRESPVFKNGGILNGKVAPTDFQMTVMNGKIKDGNVINGVKDLGDFFLDKRGRLRKVKGGLHWVLATLFVVADMAGGGIVALPTALVRCQFYPGLALIGLMAIMATTSAVMLGKSWIILLRRFPEYRNHCRKPYAEIGYRAMGPIMKSFVSICVNLTQFGASTVFLLLSCKNIQDFIYAFLGEHVSFCLIILAVALILLPITLLKSPQDFWIVVVLGMLSTLFAVILICIGTVMDNPTCGPEREFPQFHLSNYLIALGTILFTHGGHSAFPTIQHDMKKPSEFTKSAVLAFIIITGFNLTVVTLGGLTYGNSLRDSVINSIQTKWIQQSINIMITAHCLLTVTLIINPLNQEIEEMFHIPHHFGIKRFITRTLMLVTVVFVAESIPNFGTILELFGGSTVTLTSMVFPCIFYLYLAAGEKRSNEQGHLMTKQERDRPLTFKEMIGRTNFFTLLFSGIIIGFCSVAGLIATISAGKAIVTDHFQLPCYLKPFIHENEEKGASAFTATNCCGSFQNISRHHLLDSTNTCNKPKLDFYHDILL